MANVEIITIGDELLIGQVVDTNSAWMAQELNKIGFEVKHKTTIGDNERDIEKAFDRAFLRSSVILVTGGIGPTKDDITKKTLCKYFDCGLRFDGEVLKNMEELFQRLGRTINPLTYGQAYVPESCVVIQNKVGTAPIFWFEKDRKILVSMPGVPCEMKWVMQEEILGRIKEYLGQDCYIRHSTFWVEGYTESALAMHLETYEKELPGYLHLAYLPNSGFIRLRITGKHENETELNTEMQAQKDKLKELLAGNLLEEDDQPIAYTIGTALKEKSLTLSIAESCTGGNISHVITSIPGSSQYFKGGIVAYSNDLKMDILKVKPSDIDKEGVVSETIVAQMAENIQQLMQTDCAIATSGIAGPDGGTPDKPVGTVWVAARYKQKTVTKRFSFGRSREENINRATNMALLMLLKLLREA